MIFNTFFSVLFQTVIYVFEIFFNDERSVFDILKKFEKFNAELDSLKLTIWKFVVRLTRRSVRRLTRWFTVKWWFVRLIRWSTSRWSVTSRWSISTWWSISRIWKMWIRHNVDDNEIRISTKKFWFERFNWSMWFHRNSGHVT